MNMITLIIDHLTIAVPAGSTILQAAESLGITIPTLCYQDGCPSNTSCMVCVVHELGTGSLVPACSMPVSERMRIATNDDRVREARRDTLDLLLSEHAGDCEAPCRRACPAHMNIPLMIWQIREGRHADAIATVRETIPLPAVLGRICPAPCEKACYRSRYDHPVAICSLKRFAADFDLANNPPRQPAIRSVSRKRAAVIGAGPAGLSAAYFIALHGHECHVYDRGELPGGMLRYGVSRGTLPESVLDAEIESIRSLGVDFRLNQALGIHFSLNGLRDDYDAVVLAVGKADPALCMDSGVECSPRGVVVSRETFETSIPGVFAAGNAFSEGKTAVRAVAQGGGAAFSVNRLLDGLPVSGRPRKFDSVMGKLLEGEIDELIKSAEPYDRVKPSENPHQGYSESEAARESARCFQCSCRKPESCRLRQYAAEYGADKKRFAFGKRNRYLRIGRHTDIIFEPSKCIKCNRCVQIAKKAGERYGLAFIGRGFDMRLAVPFDESLENGLAISAKECVEACPVGALSWKRGEEVSQS